MMDNNKRLTPEEMTHTGGRWFSGMQDRHKCVKLMKQYAAQEGAAERITIDELSRQVNELREENERQRSMILEKSKALSATLDERDNARIWLKSLQKELADKDADLIVAVEGLSESLMQLKYLDNRFPTGSSAAIISRMETLIQKFVTSKEAGIK